MSSSVWPTVSFGFWVGGWDAVVTSSTVGGYNGIVAFGSWLKGGGGGSFRSFSGVTLRQLGKWARVL